VLITDPAPAAGDGGALELALLERLLDAVPQPSPGLPGWQSIAAAEYAVAVHELSAAVGAARAALAAARAAS
jgi:hypothetical protein